MFELDKVVYFSGVLGLVREIKVCVNRALGSFNLNLDTKLL